LRLEAQHITAAGRRFRPAAHCRKNIAQRVVRLRIIRRESQGLAATGLGLLQAAEVSQGNTQRVVCHGKVRSEAHDLVRQCNAVVVSIPLKTKYPEIVQRTDMIPVVFQDGAVESLCLIQFTLHMQRPRLLKYRSSGNYLVRLVCRVIASRHVSASRPCWRETQRDCVAPPPSRFLRAPFRSAGPRKKCSAL
jgi:hypothetical protein